MKTNDNIQDFYIKAAKFLAGELNSDEQQAFSNHCAVPENETLFNEMKRDWNKIGMAQKSSTVNTDRAWNTLFNKLESESLIATPQPKSNFTFGSWLKVAAVVTLMVSISGVFYLNPFKGSQIAIETVSENETLIRTLADGSTVYLSGNTTLSFPEKFASKERLVNLTGEAFFEVAPDRSKPFRIETNGAIVEVVGTSFKLKSLSKTDFAIQVETGIVKVFDTQNINKSYTVTAGEQLIASNSSFLKSNFTKGGNKINPAKRIHFKDEILGNVLDVVNRNYGSSLTASTSNLSSRRITVTFQGSSIDTIVAVLCASLELEDTSVNGATILTEKGQ